MRIHVLKSFLLVIACLIIIQIQLDAQDETPVTETPTVTIRPSATATVASPTPRPDVPPFIFTWAEEVIFPQAVRFTLTVDRPITQIAQLSLSIAAESQDTREIRVDPNAAAITRAETYTDFVFLWNIPPNNPLPLNGIIRYNWLVALSTNETAFVPGVFAYENSELTWSISDDPEERLSLIYPENVVFPDAARQAITPVYDLLASNTGAHPHFKIALINDEYAFAPCEQNQDGEEVLIGPRSGVEIPCDMDTVNGIFRSTGYLPLPVASLERLAFQQEILRHMVNEFYSPIWNGRDVPEWFKTGLTYFYLPGDKFYLLDVTRSASRNLQLHSLSEMNAPDTTNPSLWDAQSYSMVLYIAHRIGVQGLYSFAFSAGAEETSFADSYESIMGQPLEGLEPALENWLFRNIAEAEAQINIYGEPTLAPSATSTVTPFPPSATPLPTVTDTLTPTATSTGFKTATPLPTLTPSVTPSPRPATITPRPAGFIEATLPPEGFQVSNTSTNQEIDPIVIGIGVGVIALAVAIVLLYRRSR